MQPRLVTTRYIQSRWTYKLPVKFVSTDAELKAGQAVEPRSDTQLCWAMVCGTEAAAATTAKTRALFVPERDCFWEQEVVARALSQHRHGRMLMILVRVEAV